MTVTSQLSRSHCKSVLLQNAMQAPLFCFEPVFWSSSHMLKIPTSTNLDILFLPLCAENEPTNNKP